MLERKNIDRVFQENLKDLEIYPSKKVWNNIEFALSDKPKKRTIALWRRLSGVAVILILFLAGGYFYYNSTPNITIENPVSKSNINEVDNKAQIPIDQKTNNSEIKLAQTQNKNSVDPLEKEKPIFVKKPNNNVIITSANISSVYTNIDNKYIVDKNDFIDQLNTIEELTANNDNIIEEKTPISKKWSVGPTIAPVFYNTLQNGSPVSDNLSQSSTTSDDALSIGVKVNYQISNKFFIQSGINKVELAYNTKDVNASISRTKNAYSNINTDKSGVILSPVVNNQNIILPAANDLNKSNISGDLNQSIEYFEFPLEMKYNLYDKKLGLNLVGGFSTLILTKNSVSIVSQNSVTDLGQANNLNDFNFSGNLGVDLDYKISKSWYLNVAPMFKYQFNTYSNNSGNFRPYYFGVYSGLNYKF